MEKELKAALEGIATYGADRVAAYLMVNMSSWQLTLLIMALKTLSGELEQGKPAVK